MELREWQKLGSDYFDQNPNCLFEVATGCISGETYIDLPRDNIKNPKGIKIKNLVGEKNFYVYTFNIEKNKLELKKCKSVWSSGIKDVYEIKTNNKTIRATSNHPFIVNEYEKLVQGVGQGKRPKIINRFYKQVKDLKEGDKVLTFNRPRINWSKDGPSLKVDFNESDRKGKDLEHRFIMKELNNHYDNFTSVHHKDRNRYNNSISNLEFIDIRKHSRLHHNEDTKKSGKDIWPNGVHPKGMLNKSHSEKTKKIISRNVCLAKSNINYINYRSESGFSKTGYEIQRSERFSSEKIKESLSKIPSHERSEKSGLNGKVSYSEKIVSIKYIGKEETFDMEVEGNHNFIGNGFFIHNSGKTFLAVHLIKKLLITEPNLKVLVVGPKNVILEKTWLPELHKFGFPINRVGLYNEFAKEFAKITLISIQSLKSLITKGNMYFEEEGKKYTSSDIFNTFDMLIFDEVHNYATKNYAKIIELDRKYKIGLSATIKRKDERINIIEQAFNFKSFKYGIEKAINDNVLNPFDFTNVILSIDENTMEEYEDISKEINNAYAMRNNVKMDNDLLLKKLINQRKKLIYNYPLKFKAAKDIILKNPNSKILVFNQYNKTSKNLYWELFDIDVRADIMNSDISKFEQSKIFRRFEEGNTNILLATTMLDEGYNLPKIDIAIIMAANSTEKQFFQRMGRVLRKKDINSKVYYMTVEGTFEVDNLNERVPLIRNICNSYKEEIVE